VVKCKTSGLEGWLPLKEHSTYGITRIHFVEEYDHAGYVRRYNYEWKCFYPIQGIQQSHIISWGNGPT
jgi:hypothetical protein